MADPTPTEITEAVVRSVAGAPAARVREVSEALVRHLHAFICEVEPTHHEWAAGIDFLTRTGHMSSDTRQEFILLSDALGVSMLVDAINHRLPTGATETTVLGPFYVPPPEFEDGSDMRGGIAGAPLYISGSVRSVSGQPQADATIDIWHCDANGLYDVQQLDALPGLSARGRFRPRADGTFHLWTIRPCAYPIPTDGPVGEMLMAQGRSPFRPEHVHFMVSAPGHHKLVTHLFAAEDKHLASDVVFGVKESLVRSFERHSGGVAPDGRTMNGTWFSLDAHLVLTPLTDAGSDGNGAIP